MMTIDLFHDESALCINAPAFQYPSSTKAILTLASAAQQAYVLFQVKRGRIVLNDKMTELWLTEAQQNNAPLSYCNFSELQQSTIINHPTIDYTLGSIRDDFDMGPLVLIETQALKQYAEQCTVNYKYAGWYDLRLFLSRRSLPLHIQHTGYQYEELDLRASGQKQFDYVNPANRERQVEMEQAATNHLKKIGALISPPFQSVSFTEQEFEYEASVIIPVRNRVKTLANAIESVLNQQTNFRYNLIVIDNQSSDGTTELLQNISDNRLVHIIPQRTDLGIGGCWNEGINHPKCGRFAVQLDSDDLYSDVNTLQKIVNTFKTEQCAMVIGSYKMVNFKLEEIPPGIIDHREWTDNNGPNNALRINGLGAPRAFYTPIIRKISFPNVSYGEDYAVAIAISRTWKVGRIYEPIYLCRRWDENTDSNLSFEKMNAHNMFKDSLRTEEIIKRQQSFLSIS